LVGALEHSTLIHLTRFAAKQRFHADLLLFVEILLELVVYTNLHFTLESLELLSEARVLDRSKKTHSRAWERFEQRANGLSAQAAP